ncbi:MAG: Acyl-CoA dehydrogenase [Pseudomonadota bacterium]|jgi:alkylation response protein AidB-like acyl-CoA dehydrogenase
MNSYQPRTDEMMFLLQQVLQGSAQLQTLAPHAETDAELMQQVVEEAGKFVGSVVAPLNRDGDEIGARWHDGQVTMPPGFRDAYQAFWQAGWGSLCSQTEDGGQGLPAVLDTLLYEMLSAANHGWTMAPGLLHGAYECLRHHGSAALRQTYLPKLATGEWLATMCLTEPHAGSDLGLVRTRAVPLPDGRYALSGTKIFISGGEHDLSDNIVHLVLARLPDSPPGPKGLSLFLVPKFYEDGQRSAVFCDRIEEKMGLHGSPTCVMRFDEAPAWLVGEVGKGLGAMFIMMNAARLHVAMQGIGLLDAAWQKADAYARERRQMRAPGKGRSAAEADLIIEHPAVQRILDTQRAWVDGGRVLAYQTAIELDRATHGEGPVQAAAQTWCALITPVLKSVCTDQAFHGGSDCLQVFGGHGYVREWGIEQHIRDARVAMIYEGTNEIQAIDLLCRKVMADGGTGLMALLDRLEADLPAQAVQRSASLARLSTLRAVTRQVLEAAKQDATLPYRVADDFLRAVALVLLDWAWQRIAAQTAEADPARWQAPHQALRHWVLPEFQMRTFIIVQQCTVRAA